MLLEKFQTRIIIAIAAFMLVGFAYSNSAQAAFDHSLIDKVLKTYVSKVGMVNYKGLQANRAELDRYVASLNAVDAAAFAKWNDKEKVAFWINAYNAITLQTIVDNYPIKKRGFVFHPVGIRHIKGAWDKARHKIMGRKMSLDGIEHKTLRKDFNEPGIHMALVCAAKSCPPLRNEAYVGKRLDAQLTDQGKKFLANSDAGLRIDKNAGKVKLSSIFDWFGKDFVKTYGTKTEFKKFNKEERATLNYASKLVPEDTAKYLKASNYKLGHLDYDWGLNEQ